MGEAAEILARWVGPDADILDGGRYIVQWDEPTYGWKEAPSAESAVQMMIAMHQCGTRGFFIDHCGRPLFSHEACEDICTGRRSWVSTLLKDAKRRAKKRGTEFDLTLADLHKILDRQGLVCELSGLPFDFDHGEAYRRPWAPSLDRRDSAKGYTPNNVRLVCVAANLAMNEWGEATLTRLALAIAARHGPTKADSPATP